MYVSIRAVLTFTLSYILLAHINFACIGNSSFSQVYSALLIFYVEYIMHQYNDTLWCGRLSKLPIAVPYIHKSIMQADSSERGSNVLHAGQAFIFAIPSNAEYGLHGRYTRLSI
jgi:hypothetical protein